MTIERVNPPELARPYGFTHAVRAGGEERIYLAGQTALDQSGRIIQGTVVDQFEQALTNLLTALGSCGGSPADLASLTIYVTDIEDYKAHTREIGRVWRRLVGSDYPATAAIGVSRLWDAEALVELQGFAEVGSSAGPEGVRPY